MKTKHNRNVFFFNFTKNLSQIKKISFMPQKKYQHMCVEQINNGTYFLNFSVRRLLIHIAKLPFEKIVLKKSS